MLHSYSSEFPYGEQINVHTLLLHLLKPTSDIISSHVSCPLRHPLTNVRSLTASDCCITILSSAPSNLQEYIDRMNHQVASRCPTCASLLIRKHKFINTPPILSFDLTMNQPQITDILTISTAQGTAEYQIGRAHV